MLRKTTYTIICCITSLLLFAQSKIYLNNSSHGVQFGFSIKAQAEFSTKPQTQLPHLRIALAGGIASSFIDNNIYPSFNAELQLYNNGLGSSKPGKKNPALNCDLVTAFTITAGVKDMLQQGRSQLLLERNVPLYYFADFGLPALRNPFAYSFSFGTNIIFNTDKEKKLQRTGFLNFHFDRFQVSYSNDGGPPMSNTRLGDRKDRYYTGDVLFSYHGKPFTAINLVELSYHKFTGYTRNSFEASNQFDFAYVNYKDTVQRYYNKSLFTLNIANPVKGYCANIKLYNKTRWDVQHLIHWSIYNSYHIVPYKEHISLAGHLLFITNNHWCKMKNIISLLLTVFVCFSCARKYDISTSFRKGIPEDMQQWVLDSSYHLYLREVFLDTSDAGDKIILENNNSLTAGNKLIEIEYLLLSEQQNKVLYISTIPDKYQSYYSKKARYLKREYLNAYDFSTFRFGTTSPAANSIVFQHKDGHGNDTWQYRKEHDSILHVFQVAEHTNGNTTAAYDVDEALSRKASFVKLDSFRIAFRNMDKEKKLEIKRGRPPLQRFCKDNIIYFKKEADRYRIYFRFDKTLPTRYKDSAISFGNARLVNTPF